MGGSASSFQSSVSGITYTFNPNMATYADADQACKDAGGYLITYFSDREQVGCWADAAGVLMLTVPSSLGPA
jgi:hypothetical protein